MGSQELLQDMPAQIWVEVTGAGSNVNGFYKKLGENEKQYNGRINYRGTIFDNVTSQSRNVDIIWKHAFSKWFIVNISVTDTTDLITRETRYYYNEAQTPEPPVNGWKKCDLGKDPAPTLKYEASQEIFTEAKVQQELEDSSEQEDSPAVTWEDLEFCRDFGTKNLSVLDSKGNFRPHLRNFLKETFDKFSTSGKLNEEDAMRWALKCHGGYWSEEECEKSREIFAENSEDGYFSFEQLINFYEEAYKRDPRAVQKDLHALGYSAQNSHSNENSIQTNE